MPSQFGQIVEAIIGGISQIAMASATTAQAADTQKYVNQIRQTQQRSGQEALTTEQQKLAFQEQADRAKIQLGILKNITMEKLSKIVIITAISVTIFGIFVYYYTTVWRDDEI